MRGYPYTIIRSDKYAGRCSYNSRAGLRRQGRLKSRRQAHRTIYAIYCIGSVQASEASGASRGPFLKYASLRIRHRLIDNYRSEKNNNTNISLDAPSDDEGNSTLLDTIKDEDTPIEDMEIRQATAQEIAHLTQQLQEFGVSLSDVADNSPQQKRTLAACQKAVAYSRAHKDILEEFLSTKKIPVTRLSKEAGVEKKTLERHRRYLVAVLLICTNGYEIMRSHIVQVLKGGTEQ